MRRAITVLPLILILAACASAPQGDVAVAYSKQLKAAVGVYEETMIAAGESAERGIITEEQLDQVAAAGKVAQASLEAARAALEAYVAKRQGDPWTMIEKAQEAMLALLQAATAAGVNK